MQVSFTSLTDNIHAGRMVLKDVKSTYPKGFISNSRYETFSTHVNPQIKRKLEIKIDKTRDIVDMKKRCGYDIYDAVDFAVRKTHTANCGEQAVLVSNSLSKKGILNKIVSMEVYKNNASNFPLNGHSFCVIGLDDAADISKPETWGNDAVIVDLWSNTVAQARKAISFFSDFMHVDKKQNKVIFHSVFL